MSSRARDPFEFGAAAKDGTVDVPSALVPIMNERQRELAGLLRTLNPRLNPGTYAFCSLAAADGVHLPALHPIATFREAEGFSVIVEEVHARAMNLPIRFVAAWVTLDVASDLNAVGLTAAVSTALTRANVSCNVVAAAVHDHLFVPAERADEAMAVLRTLQQQASAD